MDDSPGPLAAPGPLPPSRPVAPRAVRPTGARSALVRGPRSPYGLDVPLDGDAVAFVRPYLVAFEERQRRRAAVRAGCAGSGLEASGVFAAGVAW